MWRVVAIAMLLAIIPSAGAVLSEEDKNQVAVSDPATGTSCEDALLLSGLRLESPAVAVLFTGQQSLAAGGDSHFWTIGELPADQTITPSFWQSGFGAELFDLRLHLLTNDGCEEVEPGALPTLDYPQWNTPTDGTYLAQVQAPAEHGGSYHLELLVAPA